MGYWTSVETWSAWLLTALSAAAATAFIVTGLFEDFFQMARSAEASLTRALSRHWFLLALGVGLILAITWPEHFVPATAWIDPRIVVVLALFLMAWTLPSRSLAAEIVRPGPALWALVLSYGALPAAAWFAGVWLPEDLRLGTLICVAGPCTRR